MPDMMGPVRGVTWAVLAVSLLASCRSAPTLEDYESRVERGRARLAAIAKAEYERDPSNQDFLLFYAALTGAEASVALYREREKPGPFAAFLVGKAVLTGLPMESGKGLSDPAAQAVLRAMDAAAPQSSLVPLYRIEWLRRSTTGERRFWRECRTLLQDALARDQWDSPIQGFYLRWFTWLEAHESDALVRAASDLRVGDGYYLTLLWVARMIAAVHFAPVPPDPLTLEVSELFQRTCLRIQERTTQALDFKTAGVALQVMLPARFLALWRTGDFSTATGTAAALDVQLDRGAREAVFMREYFKRYEAYPVFWRIGLDRMHEAFLPTIEAARGFRFDGRNREALRGFERDPEGLLEGFRSLDAGGEALLKSWREDLSASEPLLAHVLRTPPASTPGVNVLHWAVRDRAILAEGPFPPARQAELIRHAFRMIESEESRTGTEAYSWLLKEALLRPDSVPVDALKSLRTGRIDENMNLQVILHRRGVPVGETEFEDGINDVKNYSFSYAMKGYCQLLALRAKQDPTAAAAMLPDYTPSSHEEGWTMIGETLRGATGQDFGWDLGAWKAWLLKKSGD